MRWENPFDFYFVSSVKFNWRMAPFGMLRRVALVRIDVSEELSAYIIWVSRIGELGTTLAVTSNRCTLRRNSTSRRNIPEGGILHSHLREHLKFYPKSLITYNAWGKFSRSCRNTTKIMLLYIVILSHFDIRWIDNEVECLVASIIRFQVL
jgi:hypothetical protein